MRTTLVWLLIGLMGLEILPVSASTGIPAQNSSSERTDRSPVSPTSQPPVPTPSPSPGTLPPENSLTDGWVGAEPYTLTPGDRIQITITNVPEYSGAVQVLIDGTVNLPLLGRVSVWGLTLQEAGMEIAQRYNQAEFLRNPTVTLTLISVGPLKVAVTGEIRRPGSYGLPLAEGGRLPTLTEAIQRAGGFTGQANLKQVQIKRLQRSGEERTLQVSLWDLVQNGDLSQDITLRNGDRIIIPTAPDISPEEANRIAVASFSPPTIRVSFIGETKQLGSIELPSDTTLNQAILAIGGFSSRADQGAVDLIRFNANGTVIRRSVPINFSQGTSETANPVLRDRDVIVFGTSTLTGVSDILGSILSPLGQAFSLFGLFKLFSGQ